MLPIVEPLLLPGVLSELEAVVNGLLISKLARTPLDLLLLADVDGGEVKGEESWLIRFDDALMKKGTEDVWECEELEFEELLDEVRDLDLRCEFREYS